MHTLCLRQMSNVSKETFKLSFIFFRCLLHKDVFIAEFLGIYQTVDAATPAHIYAGHLISLRRYAWQKRERCDFDKVILDTLAGLRYLHSKGLVHMELTQDTLTVSNRRNISIGIPLNLSYRRKWDIFSPWSKTAKLCYSH